MINIRADGEYVLSLRREFHEYPEKSMEEKNTSERVREELKKANIEFEIVPPLGVIGILRGAEAGRTIVLRADMDALPMREDPVNEGGRQKPVVSKCDGAAHTCGHDAHTAMLLGAAQALAAHRNEFQGTLLFCFEQGEENGGGIKSMLKAMEKYPIDACWAMHTRPMIPVGQMALQAGSTSAGAMGFEVEVTGKGCHGAELTMGIDPIACCIHIINGLNDIVTRRVNPFSPVIMSIGKFQAGHAANVIPEKAEFAGTARFFTTENGDVVKKSFVQIVENICKAFRCTYTLKPGIACLPLVNDEKVTAIARKGVNAVIGEKNVVNMEPLPGSESFAEVAAKYPSAYGYLGTGNVAKGTTAAPHMPKFDIDEDALEVGANISIAVALELLKSN
jgi:amidohydrolase